MTTGPLAQIAEAITSTLSSPNVADANLEPANLIDVLDDCSASLSAIATGLHAVAKAIEVTGGAT